VFTGLPEPSLSLEAAIGSGTNDPGSLLSPEVIRSFLPLIEQLGIATVEQVQIETLRERVRAEIMAIGAVTILPALIGAWTKLRNNWRPSERGLPVIPPRRPPNLDTA